MFIKSGTIFGNLKYLGKDYEGPGSARLELVCSCGRNKSVRIHNLVNGSTKRCGLCNLAEISNGCQFGKLTYYGDTLYLTTGSQRKILTKCECGRYKSIKYVNLVSGLNTSCNECNNYFLRKGDTFGSLKYLGPDMSISPKSHKKIPLICNCGRNHITAMQYLSEFSSCGKCNYIVLRSGDKYKCFEYVGDIIEVSPFSNKKLPFKCRCGSVKDISIQYITKNQKSCGNCRNIVFNWYQENKDKLALGVPSDGVLPLGGPIVKDLIQHSGKPFKAQCVVCGNDYEPRFKDIKRGLSLTCGCTQNKTSSYSLLISNFLNNLNIKHTLEYKLDGKTYDIYIPSGKLLIEINGLHWHSQENSRLSDKLKYDLAKSNCYDYMMIYEDEILNSLSIIKSIILNRLNTTKVKSIRPSSCVIKMITHDEASDFLNKNHYLGSCSFKMGYGVYYEEILVACITFSKPTRQSSHDWELTRMASDPRFRVHGIWSSLMSRFKESTPNCSLVSFSDNRLFSGKIYQKLGFKLDGNLRPDYYWTKGRNRYHKSRLRKKKGEVGTETELRISQGYKRIWDLGKKRWVLNVT